MNTTPIVLNSRVTLARGNGGLDVDLGAMQTTSRRWLRIDELRVFIDSGEARNAGNFGDSGTDTDFGFFVDVSIRVGRYDLTSGFIGSDAHPSGELIQYIPAFLLGPRIYRRFSTINNSNALHGIFRYADQNSYIWTLPRPMYVPPNTPVAFKVRRTSTLTLLDLSTFYPNPITVEVAAVGAQLKDKPRGPHFMPHIHAWSPRNVNAQLVESGEAFKNRFDEALQVTKVIGATATNLGASVEGTTFFNGASGGSQANVICDPTQIQIFDAQNQNVLANGVPVPMSLGGPPVVPIPITSLLLAKNNSFRVHDRLARNQQWRFVVSPVINQTDPAETALLPMVALESFREVKP